MATAAPTPAVGGRRGGSARWRRDALSVGRPPHRLACATGVGLAIRDPPRDGTPMSSRVMVLTGCAGGIGRQLTGALAALGHRVVATDLDEAALAREAEARRWDPALVTRRRLDVRREDEWEDVMGAAESLGGVDVLMNVAGCLRRGYVAGLAARDVGLLCCVYAKGVALGPRAAARGMIPRRSGHSVNVGS